MPRLEHGVEGRQRALSDVERLYSAIWDRKLAAPITPPAPGTRLAVGVVLARRYAGGTLLDVGCGDGTLAALVSGSFDTLHGIELVRGAAQRAAGRGVVALVANLDRDGLPYRDRSVNLVTCLDVVEHVLNPRRLVTEIARILRPGGHCILATPNIRYWRYLRRLAVAGHFPHTSGDTEGYDGGHLHYFTFRDVEELLRSARLRPIARAATYGGRGRRLPAVLRSYPPLQELLATGAFVVAQCDDG
jgi:methionine biosynthesis protein MetW